jgi:hypothetical protein
MEEIIVAPSGSLPPPRSLRFTLALIKEFGTILSAGGLANVGEVGEVSDLFGLSMRYGKFPFPVPVLIGRSGVGEMERLLLGIGLPLIGDVGRLACRKLGVPKLLR